MNPPTAPFVIDGAYDSGVDEDLIEGQVAVSFAGHPSVLSLRFEKQLAIRVDYAAVERLADEVQRAALAQCTEAGVSCLRYPVERSATCQGSVMDDLSSPLIHYQPADVKIVFMSDGMGAALTLDVGQRSIIIHHEDVAQLAAIWHNTR